MRLYKDYSRHPRMRDDHNSRIDNTVQHHRGLLDDEQIPCHNHGRFLVNVLQGLEMKKDLNTDIYKID
jgi:hypothetical protein